MASSFRTMTQDQRDMLAAIDGKLTSQELFEHFGDRFEKRRVIGLLSSLQFRGLAGSLKGQWSRTRAGEEIAKKLEDGTYGRLDDERNSNR